MNRTFIVKNLSKEIQNWLFVLHLILINDAELGAKTH